MSVDLYKLSFSLDAFEGRSSEDVIIWRIFVAYLNIMNTHWFVRIYDNPVWIFVPTVVHEEDGLNYYLEFKRTKEDKWYWSVWGNKRMIEEGTVRAGGIFQIPGPKRARYNRKLVLQAVQRYKDLAYNVPDVYNVVGDLMEEDEPYPAAE